MALQSPLHPWHPACFSSNRITKAHSNSGTSCSSSGSNFQGWHLPHAHTLFPAHAATSTGHEPNSTDASSGPLPLSPLHPWHIPCLYSSNNKPTSPVALALPSKSRPLKAHFICGTPPAPAAAASSSPPTLWHPQARQRCGICKPANVAASSSPPTSRHLQSPLHPWHPICSSSVSSIKPTVPVALQSTHFT